MTQQEWLQIGLEKGIIESENLISSDNKNDMSKNLENKNKPPKRTVTQRKDGRFMCYVRLESGRKAVYGKTPEEALKKAEQRELEEKEQLSDEIKYSFESYYKKWFLAKMKTNVRPQTIDRIENTFNKYYAKAFCKTDIRRLDESTIIDFLVNCINTSDKKYMTRKEFIKVMQIMRESYNTYYDECILSHKSAPNVISWTTVRRKVEEQAIIQSPKKKEIALSESERKSLEETALCEKKVSSLIWILVTCTGLRLGEVTALTWKDVDFKNCMLYISKSVCKYYKRDNQGRRIKQVYDIGETKTAHGKREIPLTERALSVLQCLKELHLENGWYRPEQLLCYDGREYVARPSKLANDLKALCERAGVPSGRIHPHLLRKTVATVLHEAGMSTRDIADILGHSDISTTEQCYIISTEAEQKRKKMAAVL